MPVSVMKLTKISLYFPPIPLLASMQQHFAKIKMKKEICHFFSSHKKSYFIAWLNGNDGWKAKTSGAFAHPDVVGSVARPNKNIVIKLSDFLHDK